MTPEGQSQDPQDVQAMGWSADVPSALLPRLRDVVDALTRDPRNLGLALGLMQELLTAGRTEAAAGLGRLAAAYADRDPRGLMSVSALLDAAGDREAAIRTACDAAAGAPNDPACRQHAGNLLLVEGRHAEAGPHLAAYAMLVGDDGNAWYMLSICLHGCGDTWRALEAAEKAAALAPDHLDYTLHIAGLLGVLGRYGDAIATISAFVERCPSEPRAWRSLGAMREAVGDYGPALAALERAQSLDPADAAVARHRADLAERMGPAALSEDDLAHWRPGRRRRRERPPRRPPPSPARRVAAWVRRVHSLMLWEMQTRFAHSRLGYLWGVVEPLGHVATIGVVFAFANVGHPPIGDNLFLFYITGVCLYMSFSRTSEEIAGAMMSNRPVLQLPGVRPLDVVLGKLGVSLATDVVSLVVLLSGMGMIGVYAWPADLGPCALAVILVALVGSGVGMINMVIRLFLPSWEHVWQIMARFLYFLSGIYYSPIVMPEAMLKIVLWNPILHGIELFRHGFYAEYDPPWLDVSYLMNFAIGAVLLGLALQRLALRRLLSSIAL